MGRAEGRGAARARRGGLRRRPRRGRARGAYGGRAVGRRGDRPLPGGRAARGRRGRRPHGPVRLPAVAGRLPRRSAGGRGLPRLTPPGGDRPQHARAGHEETDAHEHAQAVHVGRKRLGSDEQRDHGDQGGQGPDEEHDGTGADQSVTGPGGIRLGFVTHRTRVVPARENDRGTSCHRVQDH
ncbi:hypothetical protein SGPA1_50687 [Streptomyces misionensis JCM 4497]